MQSTDFLTSLAAVSTANPDSLQDFRGATQAQPLDHLPKLVPIGTHVGVHYFLQSSDRAIHVDAAAAAAPPPAKAGDVYYGVFAYEAKSIPAGTPMSIDLTYGFGLGRLYHSTSTATDAEDTGFFLICNAVDKSIWAAFDFEPYGETGDITPVEPQYGDPYGQLPSDTQKLVIGAMKLFGKEWMAKKPLSLDGGDPFGGGAGKPLACKLVAKPAYVADVLKAIKDGGPTQSKPVEPSRTGPAPAA